jgi:hypothetical protein
MELGAVQGKALRQCCKAISFHEQSQDEQKRCLLRLPADGHQTL